MKHEYHPLIIRLTQANDYDINFRRNITMFGLGPRGATKIVVHRGVGVGIGMLKGGFNNLIQKVMN